MADSLAAPERVLDVAATVLRQAGFTAVIEPFEDVGGAWLLAENELFALGALAGNTLENLTTVESYAVDAMLARLGGLGSGAKRWDAYLVLITPQRWSDVDSRERVEVVYNTRGIRRLVAAEVLPDSSGDLRPALAHALKPFLPLGEPLNAALEDLDQSLADALVLNGVKADIARRYVAAFRSKGSLDDV